MCIRDSVNAICQEIKAKYEYADADYMVVVPDGILDIITEAVSYTHLFRVNDRIMQTKNTEKVSNGDLGFIRYINDTDQGLSLIHISSG